MARVLVFMLPELGHLLPLLRIARGLEARGNEVRFLGLPDCRDLFAAQGVRFEAVGASLFPPGSLAKHNPMGSVLESRRLYAAFLGVLRDPATFSAPRGSLLLADALLPAVAIAGHGAGLRVVTIHINFPYTREDGLPPLTTGLPPGARGLAGFRSALAWRATRLGRAFVEGVGMIAFGWPDELGCMRQLATDSGYPPEYIDDEGSMGYRLAFPELVLCPAAFDFPHPPRPNRRYVEPSLDLDRREPELPSSRLDASARLVLLALGSQSHRYRPASRIRRLFRAAVEAVGARPGYQLVIASGGLDVGFLDPLPPNVLVMSRAPQIALLRRAWALVTHGGIGSIKEALYFGVPLVIFPLMLDQPGNAARVEYHRVGVAGDIRRTSKAAFEALLRRVEAPGIREAARRLGLHMRQAEARSEGRAAIERLAVGEGDYELLPPRRRSRIPGHEGTGGGS